MKKGRDLIATLFRGVSVTEARRRFLSGPTDQGNGPPEKDRFDSGTPHHSTLIVLLKSLLRAIYADA